MPVARLAVSAWLAIGALPDDPRAVLSDCPILPVTLIDYLSVRFRVYKADIQQTVGTVANY